MGKSISIFLASSLGCLSRYWVSLYVVPAMGFPLSTLVVNVCGGFLGGFTTFSALSLECLTLLQNQQILTAIFYILVSVILSVGAAWLGCTI